MAELCLELIFRIWKLWSQAPASTLYTYKSLQIRQMPFLGDMYPGQFSAKAIQAPDLSFVINRLTEFTKIRNFFQFWLLRQGIPAKLP